MLILNRSITRLISSKRTFPLASFRSNPCRLAFDGIGRGLSAVTKVPVQYLVRWDNPILNAKDETKRAA